MELRRVLFWDIQYEQLDWDKNAVFILERVAMYGNLSEWQAVLNYYGVIRIKKMIKQISYLDKKTLNYLSLKFNIHKQEFNCYTRQQSNPSHFPS
ncbi:MAG: hypothetical protein COC01_09790 [Bacteroidetes bacterium]|nr:MAG: hypothetical protein COC01_09790 [Bacteroidota bacterium]